MSKKGGIKNRVCLAALPAMQKQRWTGKKGDPRVLAYEAPGCKSQNMKHEVPQVQGGAFELQVRRCQLSLSPKCDVLRSKGGPASVGGLAAKEGRGHAWLQGTCTSQRRTNIATTRLI